MKHHIAETEGKVRVVNQRCGHSDVPLTQRLNETIVPICVKRGRLPVRFSALPESNLNPSLSPFLRMWLTG